MFSAASAQIGGVAADAGRPPHQALERVADVGQVQRLAAVDRRRLASGTARKSSASGRRRARGPLAGMGPVDQPFEQAVRGQAIGAVQAAGSDFAGGPQPGQRRAAVADRRVTPPIM